MVSNLLIWPQESSNTFSSFFEKITKINPKSCIIAFNFGQFSTYFDRKIKNVELLTMDPNTPWESNWVGPTIQYAFKRSIYPFQTCTDIVTSSLTRTFMATYNGRIWFQTSLYDPKMYPLGSQDFSPPGPVTSKFLKKRGLYRAFNFGIFWPFFARK